MPEKKNFDLSLSQIAAGGAAAVTAALLGSRLGVAGTVVGAALASVVTTTANAVYSHSLARSAARVHTWRGDPAHAPTAAPADATTGSDTATAADTGHTADTAAAIEHAEHVERVDHTTVRVEPATETTSGSATEPADSAAEFAAEPAEPADESAAGTRSRRRFAVAAGSLAAFAIGLVVVTGIEAVRGGPVSGGDGGTTLSRVVQGASPDGGGSRAPADDTPAPTTEPPDGPTSTANLPPTTPPTTSTEPSATPEPTTGAPTPTTVAPTTDRDPTTGSAPVIPTAQRPG